MRFVGRFITTVLALGGATSFATGVDEGVPALKVIATNGAENLLVGSMHIPFEGLGQPSPTILRGKKRLVIESSVTAGPQPQKLDIQDILAPNALEDLKRTGKLGRAPWATQLSAEQVAELRKNASCMSAQADSMAVDMMLAMKSAANAATLAYWPCSTTGQRSRDEIFNQAAATYELPIVTLETQAAVDKRRKAVPSRIYEEQLREAFTEQTRRNYSKIVSALNTGNYAAVADTMNSGYATPMDAALVQKIMVDDRNLAWMPTLEHYFSEGNAVVLVGAGHLPGSHGLVALLQKVGYRVTPVSLPANGS